MSACTWCNHIHDEGCTRTITVKVGKTTTESPCPCNRKAAQHG